MVSIKNNELTSVELSDVADKGRFVPVDCELVKIARNMGVTFGD
jgi:6-phosphofructokinase 1